MEIVDKYTQMHRLAENAMFADAFVVFTPEILSDWQNRMRTAAAWCDSAVPDPPAFTETVTPDRLRRDMPENKLCAYITESSRLCSARTDMTSGDYIRVPKVVGE